MATILKFAPLSKRSRESEFRSLLTSGSERELLYHLKNRVYTDDYDGITKPLAALLIKRLFDRNELTLLYYIFCSQRINERLPLLRKLFALSAINKSNFNDILNKLSKLYFSAAFLQTSEALLLKLYDEEDLDLHHFLEAIEDAEIQKQFKYLHGVHIYSLSQIMMFLLQGEYLSMRKFIDILKKTDDLNSFLSSSNIYDYFFEREEFDRSSLRWKDFISEQDVSNFFSEIGSSFELMMHLAANANRTLLHYVVTEKYVDYRKLYLTVQTKERLDDILSMLLRAELDDSQLDDQLSKLVSLENEMEDYTSFCRDLVMYCLENNQVRRVVQQIVFRL